MAKTEDNAFDTVDMTVTELSADELLLRAQGHVQEMPRQFSAFSTLALAFSMTNSWVGISAVFATPLLCGGGPGVIYGLLVASVVCSIINAGLAELASAFPSSGGQYHFAFMVASPKTRAAAAFVVGWLSVVAWCLTSASTAIFCAQIVFDLASFYHADFVATQWQVWCAYVVFMVVAACIVCLLPKLIPKMEIVFFLCNICGFVVFLIVVLATSKASQKPRTVFVDYNNETGGWSDGTAFMLGVGICMYTYVAVDGCTHISEEVPNPGRNIPRAMWLTMVIGICTAVPWTLAFMFSTTDLDSVSVSALPILTVYYQAMNSQAVAAVFTCWLLWIYFGALISCIATAGRLTWAFARDQGLPFSKHLSKVDKRFEVPLNATLTCVVVVILYGLIYIGSTTAFNSFISMSILSLNVTYVVPQAIVLFRGRDNVLPPRHFNLGKYFGPFCNAFSVAWVLLYTILFCFPVFVPPTLQDMNYVSIVVAGIVLIIAALWCAGWKKTFVGPDVHIEGIDVSQRLSISSHSVTGVKKISV